MPQTGRLARLALPHDLARVDSGVAEGDTVTPHYDPMIAKVIAHGTTRQGAATALAKALRRAHIHGSTTNRALLVRVLEHPEFLSGETDTHFLQRNDVTQLGRPLLDATQERVAALAAALADQAAERSTARVLATMPSGWRNSPSQTQQRAYSGHYGTHEIGYSLLGPFPLDGVGMISVLEATPESVSIEVGEIEQEFQVARYEDLRYVDTSVGPAKLTAIPRFPSRYTDEDPGSLHAPMPGKVVRVTAAVGDEVSDGEGLVVMEAMKMEHTLRSPHAGTVADVRHRAGDQVEADEVLVVVEEG